MSNIPKIYSVLVFHVGVDKRKVNAFQVAAFNHADAVKTFQESKLAHCATNVDIFVESDSNIDRYNLPAIRSGCNSAEYWMEDSEFSRWLLVMARDTYEDGERVKASFIKVSR